MKIIILITFLLCSNVTNDNKVATYESITEKVLVIKTNRKLYKLLPFLMSMDSLERIELLSNAAIESGWGNSSLSVKHNNYFGIKGKDVQLRTTEYKNDSLYYCSQYFKKFNSIEECVRYRLTRVNSKKLGTCPTSIYKKLQHNIKLIINKEVSIKDTIIWQRKY